MNLYSPCLPQICAEILHHCLVKEKKKTKKKKKESYDSKRQECTLAWLVSDTALFSGGKEWLFNQSTWIFERFAEMSQSENE